MAYDLFNPDDDQQENKVKQRGGSSIIQGSGQSPYNSNNNATGSGNWTNLQNYIDANPDAGNQLSDTIIDQQVEKPMEAMGDMRADFEAAKGRYDQEYDVFNSQDAYNDLINNGTDQAIARLNRQFNQPEGYNSRDFSGVQSNIDRLQNEQGRLNALKDLNPESSAGNLTLNNLFLQRQAGNKFADLNVDNAKRQNEEFTNQFNSYAQDRQQQAQNSINDFSNLLQDKYTESINSNNQLVADAQKQRQQVEQGIKTRYATGQATGQDLQRLGVDPSMYEYVMRNKGYLPVENVDLMNQVTANAPEINLSNAVSAQELSKQNAVRQALASIEGLNQPTFDLSDLDISNSGVVDPTADYYSVQDTNQLKDYYGDIISGQSNYLGELSGPERKDLVYNYIKNQNGGTLTAQDIQDDIVIGNMLNDLQNNIYDDSRYGDSIVGQRSKDMMDDQGNLTDESRLLLDRFYEIVKNAQRPDYTPTNQSFDITNPKFSL